MTTTSTRPAAPSSSTSAAWCSAGVPRRWSPSAAAASRDRRRRHAPLGRSRSSRPTAATGATSTAASSSRPSSRAASPRAPGLTEAEVAAIVEAAPRELEPLPDTVAWLRRLHAQGRPLHFLSNMPEPFAAHFERTHDFMALFESGVFSARVQLLKPEPEIYAHAARGVRPRAGRPAVPRRPPAQHRRRARGRLAGRPFRRRGAGRGRSAGARLVTGAATVARNCTLRSSRFRPGPK